MTSTIKTNNLTNVDNGTDLDLSATGATVNLPAGFKVSGTVGVPIDNLQGSGTSGQILTSNGTGSAPTFQDAAGGGAWAVKSSGTLSSASELVLSNLSKTTKVILSDITNSSNAEIRCQLSDDNGSTWKDSVYRYFVDRRLDNGTSNTDSSQSSSFFKFAGIDLPATAGNTLAVEAVIYSPQTATSKTLISGLMTLYTAFGLQGGNFSATYSIAAAIDAWRIYPQTGTISGSYVILELN